MNYAYLFAGLAAGSILPWIIMFLILRVRNTDKADSNRPNELLEERNAIGECEARALAGINASLSLISQHDPADRRERIASMALQGYLAGRTHDSASMPGGDNHHRYVAESCLKYTDALIAELDGEINAKSDALNALDVMRTVATPPHHPNALNAIREIAQREIDIASGKERA